MEKATNYKKTLKNGLKVVFIPNKDTDIVAINVKGRCGSLYDSVPGVSHLAEHLFSDLLLKNQDREYPFKYLGITSRETVTYYFKFMSEDIESVMENIVKIFENKSFDEEKVEIKKKELKNEMFHNESSPERISLRNYTKLLFKNERVKKTNTGTSEDIKNITNNDVSGFINTYYNPKNFVLSICCNFNKNAVFNYAKKYLENLQTEGNEIPELPKIEMEPAIEEVEEKIFFSSPNYEYDKISFVGYSMEDPKHYTLNLISQAFDTFLKEVLKMKMGILYKVECESYSSGNYGTFSINLETSPDKFRDIKKIIEKSVQNFEQILTAKKIEEAKKVYLATKSFDFEKSSYKCHYYGEYALHGKEYMDYNFERKYILNLTDTEILNVAEEVFSQKMKILRVGDVR